MRKLGIAIFTGNYNHIRDGVSHTLNRLVGHLEKRGHRVIVFGPYTPNPAFKHTGDFMPVCAIPAPTRSEYRISLSFPKKAREKLKLFKPDIIHISTPDFLGFLGLRYAIKNNIAVVGSFHTHFSSYLKYYKLGFFERIVRSYLIWFYRNTRHLYVPSNSMIETLKKENYQTNFKLWTRGVDTKLYDPEKRNQNWRKKAGISEEEIAVVFVSRLVKEKNLKMLVAVFKEIKKRNPLIRTVIVGDGPSASTLKKELPDTIFTGFLAGEALAASYAGSDIFFFPSDTESFGNVTLEAMSSGLPAVVADAVGSRSLVEDGVNGYRADATDKDAFVKILTQLTDSPDLRLKMSRASREKAMTYDWDHILDQLISYYMEVIE